LPNIVNSQASGHFQTRHKVRGFQI